MSTSILEPRQNFAARRHCATQAPADRVRVLQVINGEDYSGAERVQDLLALCLPECGFDTAFACVVPNRFAAARKAQQAPLSEFPMRHRCDVRPAWAMSRYIRREGFQLVHTHSPRALLIGRPAAALAGVPLVHHVHCQTGTEVERVWQERLTKVMERATARGAAALIAVSATCRRYLLENGYAESRVHLAVNGVPARAALPERDVPSVAWNIGTVAMFRPRKGTEMLLEALSQLRRSGLNVRLRAVGRFQSPEYEQQVLALAERLELRGAIDWVGFRRDVDAEFDRMDLFVLPSLVSEAMPMSILEAMAAGVPVVGSRVDGITDLVCDGHTGLLAEPGNASDLARAISRLVRGEADWRQLRVTAYERQVQEFSDRSMAVRVADVYRHVLSLSSGTGVPPVKHRRDACATGSIQN